MEFVSDLFLEQVFEIILTRVAKELPIITNRDLVIPYWINPSGSTGDVKFIYSPSCRHGEAVACPYAELGGRWGEKFEYCRENWVFVTIALYLPTERKCAGMGVYGEYKLFTGITWTTSYEHCCTTKELFENRSIEKTVTHKKNFLLDVYIVGCRGAPDSWNELPLTPKTLELVGGMLVEVKHRSNPLICFVNLNPDVPFLADILSLLPRNRQYDTEVVNSPKILHLLHRNQQNITEQCGKTLWVASRSSRCLDAMYAALEIDSFDEFRFRRSTRESFDGTGFLEGAKKSLNKRSNKGKVTIVIEDLSLAEEIIDESVYPGDVIVDGDVTVKIKRRKETQIYHNDPFKL